MGIKTSSPLSTNIFWSCLTIVYLASIVAGEYYEDLPLQWKFLQLPTTACQKRETCSQAALKKGNVLMFDGFTRRTWNFNNIENYWTLVPTSNSPEGRSNYALGSLGNGKVLLFGGWDGNQVFKNTWIFDENIKDWSQIINTDTTTSPKPRGGHAIASTGEGKILLYGGKNKEDRYHYGDSWCFDISTKEWTRISTTKSPKPRAFHAMSLLGSRDLLMFGGDDQSQSFADSWLFVSSTKQWIQIETTSAKSPTARVGHAIASLGNNSVLMFGGYASNQPISESWIFKKSTKEWIQIDNSPIKTSINKLPPARYSHSLASLREGNVLMYGGVDRSQTFSDTWVFNNNNKNRWTQIRNITPLTKSAKSRFSHAIASIKGQALMFGGLDENLQLLNDTWIFVPNKKRWTQIDNITVTNNFNLARESHAMASLENSVLLFGGYANGQPLSDSWIFKKSTKEWIDISQNNTLFK